MTAERRDTTPAQGLAGPRNQTRPRTRRGRTCASRGGTPGRAHEPVRTEPVRIKPMRIMQRIVLVLVAAIAGNAFAQGLDIDIVDGTATALPIAIVPFGFEGAGLPP